MKISLWLLLFCLSLYGAIAQQTLDSGYIFYPNKDTVKGFFQVSLESELSSSIQFKKERNGPLKKYSPSDISGFLVNKDHYYSMQFQNSSEDSIITDTAFVKQLVGGEYNLYSYRRPDRTFYLLQKDTAIHFLYDRVTEGSGAIIKEGNYLNYMSFISLNCENLKYKVESVDYSEKSLSAFVFDANKCLSGKSVSYYQTTKSHMQPVAFVGGLPLGKSSQITADFSLRFTFPRIDKKTSLNIGLHYSNTKEQVTRFDGYLSYKTYIQTDLIYSLPVTVQYTILTGRIQPYAFGGFSLAFLKEETPYPNFSNQNFGVALVAGAGLDVRVVNGLYVRAEWRYELIIQYPAIGISYRF